MRETPQASVDETWEPYAKWKLAVEQPKDLAAWDHAPTPESAPGPQGHAPLFTSEGIVRANIDDPKEKKHVSFQESWYALSSRLGKSKTFKKY